MAFSVPVTVVVKEANVVVPAACKLPAALVPAKNIPLEFFNTAQFPTAPVFTVAPVTSKRTVDAVPLLIAPVFKVSELPFVMFRVTTGLEMVESAVLV